MELKNKNINGKLKNKTKKKPLNKIKIGETVSEDKITGFDKEYWELTPEEVDGIDDDGLDAGSLKENICDEYPT